MFQSPIFNCLYGPGSSYTEVAPSVDGGGDDGGFDSEGGWNGWAPADRDETDDLCRRGGACGPGGGFDEPVLASVVVYMILASLATCWNDWVALLPVCNPRLYIKVLCCICCICCCDGCPCWDGGSCIPII